MSLGVGTVKLFSKNNNANFSLVILINLPGNTGRHLLANKQQ